MWLYSLVCVGPGQKPRRPVFSQRGSYGMVFLQFCGDSKLHSLLVSIFMRCAKSVEPHHDKTCYLEMRKISGADQLCYCALISAFAFCCKNSIVYLVSKSKTLSVFLASVALQLAFYLTWSEIPITGFSCGEAKFTW